jgi:nucleoside-diphosphate-sugar epimerase
VRLRLVSRRPARVPPGGLAEVEMRQADLTTAGAVADAVSDASVILHLLLYDSGASWRVAKGDLAGERVNVGVARELIEVLRGRRSGPPVVVFAGSTSQDDPVTEYDRQKLAAEDAFLAATADGVLRGISLRLATVFGHSPTSHNEDRGVVVTMIRKALAGEPLTVWDGCTARRDLLHVDDLADAFLAALDNPDALAGRHWAVGAGEGIHVADLFSAIAAAVSVHTGRAPVPVVSVPAPAYATAADFRSSVSDSSAFRMATGWRPRVPLGEALRCTVVALERASFT